MNDRLPAEQLPALYRGVLDDIWELERAGARATAAGLRREAIRAYAATWDARAVQRLEEIGRRTRSALIVARRPAGSPVHGPMPRLRALVRRTVGERTLAPTSHRISPGLG